MQAYEFKLEPSNSGGLMIPFEVQQLLSQLKKARAILLVEDEEKSAEWNRSAGVFFKARNSQIETATDDLPAVEIAKLAESGGAFDFLAEPEEDIYSDEDLKVRYR